MPLPSLENFTEGEHWWVPAYQGRWTRWDVIQDPRQRWHKLGLDAVVSVVLSAQAQLVCHGELARGLQGYNLLGVSGMQSSDDRERRQVHRNEVLCHSKRLHSVCMDGQGPR